MIGLPVAEALYLATNGSHLCAVIRNGVSTSHCVGSTKERLGYRL